MNTIGMVEVARLCGECGHVAAVVTITAAPRRPRVGGEPGEPVVMAVRIPIVDARRPSFEEAGSPRPRWNSARDTPSSARERPLRKPRSGAGRCCARAAAVPANAAAAQAPQTNSRRLTRSPIGTGEERWWDREAEGLRGAQVDDQIKRRAPLTSARKLPPPHVLPRRRPIRQEVTPVRASKSRAPEWRDASAAHVQRKSPPSRGERASRPRSIA